MSSIGKLYFLIGLLWSLDCSAFFYEQQDKNKHVAVAAGLTYLGTYALTKTTRLTPMQSYLLSASLVFTAGIFKETMYDKFADEKDIQANFVGVALAFPLVTITF